MKKANRETDSPVLLLQIELPLCRARQIVLQHADFDASAGCVLFSCSLGTGWGIAHALHVDAINRDVMREHQIPSHGLRHLLRTSNSRLPASGSEAAHFNDVAALIFQGGGHLV